MPGQDVTTALWVPLTVTAHHVPALTQRKGSDTVKIQRIDCEYIGCTIGRWLDPTAFQTEYPLEFDNPSLEPFVMNGTVATFGDVTHGSADELLTPGTNVQVPVAAQFKRSMPLNPVVLSPDH